jgi:hypothetical protein
MMPLRLRPVPGAGADDMRQHLAAGGPRDAEIAILEKGAQARALEILRTEMGDMKLLGGALDAG